MRSQDFRPGGDGYAATIKLLFTIFMQNDRFRRILGVFFLTYCYVTMTSALTMIASLK